jgi:ADP-heptose:LPS heptosyltransferase
VQNLDLIISVDTAIAHLAGAMARPTWVLIPKIPDFRWLRERNDSPWYPTMRLFRQGRGAKDWSRVIGQIANELAHAPILLQKNELRPDDARA